MSPATIEERVRDYVAAERERIPVPPFLPNRILRAVEVSLPAPRRPRLGFLRTGAAMAAMLLLGIGIASIRLAQSPAGQVQGTWSSGASMAVNRGSHTATLLPNGKVLVIGGTDGVRPVAVSVELYDPKTAAWSSAGSVSVPRWGHTATLLPNGKVLVAGGSQADGISAGSLASVDLYDPATNAWSVGAPMRTPRSFHTATLLVDGRVLVAGGIESTSDIAGRTLASTEVYDPASNTWTIGPPMTTPRAKHVAIALGDNRVLVIGGTAGLGLTEAAGEWRSAELYDPARQSWSPVDNMQYARILPSANLLPDGRVLVVGDDGINYRTAELFDPNTGRWSVAPDPGVGRAEAATTKLSDGNVLVAGGAGQTSAQVFDWHRNQWSNAGDLARVRAAATATLLANGHVLIAGGFGNLVAPWASAELYDPTGRHTVAIAPDASKPGMIVNIIPFLVIAAVLLGSGIWWARRRQALWRGRNDPWIDLEA